MNNFVMYRDNQIAFLNALTKLNGISEPLTDEVCVVSAGYLIPLSPTAFTIIDHLESTTIPSVFDDHFAAVIVDENGVVREYAINTDGIRVNRRPVGPGFKGCCSRWLETEEVAWASLQITETLEEAVELYCTKQGIDKKLVKIISLSEVTNLLNKEGQK